MSLGVPLNVLRRILAANMKLTTIKIVMVLGWVCVAEAQRPVRPVIFPDDRHSTISNNRQPLISNNRQSGLIGSKPRCKDNNEDENAPCLNDIDYNPGVETLFRHLLARFRGSQVVRNEFFQNLTIPEKVAYLDDPNGPKNEFDYDPACKSEERIIFPKRAKNQNKEWVFVLNQGKRRQAVKVEQCSNNNAQCNLGAAGTEVNSVCRQKYIYRKLLVMNGPGTDIVAEHVLMPSCCVCYIKKERNFGFGFRSGPNNNRGNNFGPINNRQRNNGNQFSMNQGFAQG